MTQHVTHSPIEVTGQIWGGQLDPPGGGEGGTFRVLPGDDRIIPGPYPTPPPTSWRSGMDWNPTPLEGSTAPSLNAPSEH